MTEAEKLTGAIHGLLAAWETYRPSFEQAVKTIKTLRRAGVFEDPDQATRWEEIKDGCFGTLIMLRRQMAEMLEQVEDLDQELYDLTREALTEIGRLESLLIDAAERPEPFRQQPKPRTAPRHGIIGRIMRFLRGG